MRTRRRSRIRRSGRRVCRGGSTEGDVSERLASMDAEAGSHVVFERKEKLSVKAALVII